MTPNDPAIWDVTALRRLLCWARENERLANHIGVTVPELREISAQLVKAGDERQELERLFRLEDTR